ncbi:uncharacterized protein LOC111699815 [Eurytemora carolleeae]|uniref:uncharacterized protein LOC111699815 n=1 Tax=Eurytemora carolleeae TaxID=1294199 RepID=UPI000C77D7AD|nr:uncharacterized protein LOC111699815 [Eurytemora carolleeae]|eukprot:XP_023326318.1 uncharacterized protein LOC111699815 [Eurytemora affinis]
MQLLASILVFSLLVLDSDAIQCYQCTSFLGGECSETAKGSVVTCPDGITSCTIVEAYAGGVLFTYSRGCVSADSSGFSAEPGCTTMDSVAAKTKSCNCATDKCNESFETAGARAVQFSLVAAILSAVLINQL